MAEDDNSAATSNGHKPNGDIEDGHHEPQYQKDPNSWSVRVAAIVEDFSFIWFTLSMNTGLLGILMHQLPYQFRGLGIISTIMFMFDIVLFTIFFTILLARIVFFPKAILKSITGNLVEAGMTGAVPIAWFTIVAQVGLTVSQASWGGHAWFVVAYVMWWIGTTVMMISAVALIIIVSKHRIADTEKLTPALILPFVGTTTDALVGGLICQFSHGVNERMAVPVIIVSYMLNGIGFFAAMMIYAAYLVRLTNVGMPKSFLTPSLVLLVGPCGQSSAALQALGSAAVAHFGNYNKGTFITAGTANILAAVGTWLGLMLTGFGMLFLLFCAYTLLEVAFKREHKYTMLWWSVIFPTGTVNTAFILFADEMDSPAFRILATILLIVLVIAYVGNWTFTLRDIYLGKILNGKRSENPASNRIKAQ